MSIGIAMIFLYGVAIGAERGCVSFSFPIGLAIGISIGMFIGMTIQPSKSGNVTGISMIASQKCCTVCVCDSVWMTGASLLKGEGQHPCDIHSFGS